MLQQRKKCPQVSAVLFDMDNTLFDFVQAQLAGCRAILDHLGLADDEQDLFAYFRRPVHGFEHHDNIRDFLTDRDCFTVRNFAECSAVYDAMKLSAVRPFDGIDGVLSRLNRQGVPLAIVTDARDGNAVKRLDKARLHQYFSAVISPDISGAAKPDPASFCLACNFLRADLEATVLIGDSIRRDIEPAQALCMKTVYAQYGDRYASGLTSSCVPDFVAKEVQDISAILNRLLS